jgi:hypothetical protein
VVLFSFGVCEWRIGLVFIFTRERGGEKRIYRIRNGANMK